MKKTREERNAYQRAYMAAVRKSDPKRYTQLRRTSHGAATDFQTWHFTPETAADKAYLKRVERKIAAAVDGTAPHAGCNDAPVVRRYNPITGLTVEHRGRMTGGGSNPKHLFD